MVMNGTEYVPVQPAATARGGALHPSLPTRPGFDIAPKEEVVPKGKKMSAAQREAAALNAGKNSLLEAQASNRDVVENRKKIRMANQSAAQLLKAELAGDSSPAENAATEEKVEIEVEEEKEEMTKPDAQAVLDEQAEDEGVDEEVVQPPVAVADEENGMDGVEGSSAAPATSKSSRGTKRKIEEREDAEENAEGDAASESGSSSSSSSSESETEAPPDVEADQPVSKKKLKVNPDGTVEGYEDEVR